MPSPTETENGRQSDAEDAKPDTTTPTDAQEVEAMEEVQAEAAEERKEGGYQ